MNGYTNDNEIPVKVTYHHKGVWHDPLLVLLYWLAFVGFGWIVGWTLGSVV